MLLRRGTRTADDWERRLGMRLDRRFMLLTLLVLLGATAALMGGASSSTAGTGCSDGRPFCVTVDGLDGRSLSTTASPHYLFASVTITNTGGTSTLTNGKLTLTLRDVIGGDIEEGTVIGGTKQASTARLQTGSASDGRCSGTSNVITCTVPNLPGGSAGTTTYGLVFRTSTTDTATATETDDADGTEIEAFATFKEKGSDNQPKDPQPDEATATEIITYEPDPNLDISYAFPTASVTLATSATADSQHTVFPLPTIPGVVLPFYAKVEELALTTAGSPCGTNTCYGELVDTNTAGNSELIFSAEKPAHVTITWDFLPSGKTKNNIVVYHKLDSGFNEPPITSTCTFASGIPTNLPCRDVDIKRGGGNVVVTIDVWSAGNGRWGVG
jgi:hypothetical protein